MNIDSKNSEPGETRKLSYADSVYIILVQPQQSLNIGSVARAMMNLGFSKLRLVSPENFDLQKAGITARWAIPIIETAEFFNTLEEALADSTEVVGFGGRYDGQKFEAISLPQWISTFKPVAQQRLALVFGPEDRGLCTDEINLCRWLVRIPSTAEYSSYNLAQAVLLALYELSRTEWGVNVTEQAEREMPEWNDFFQLERILDEVLTTTGFYREGTPEPIPGVIKRLFQRMNPDKREMGILLAMVSRISKTLKRS